MLWVLSGCCGKQPDNTHSIYHCFFDPFYAIRRKNQVAIPRVNTAMIAIGQMFAEYLGRRHILQEDSFDDNHHITERVSVGKWLEPAGHIFDRAGITRHQ